MDKVQVVNDREAARFLGLAPQTLRNWRTNRKGPKYVRLGGRIVYRLVDLNEFLNRGVIDPATEAGER